MYDDKFFHFYYNKLQIILIYMKNYLFILLISVPKLTFSECNSSNQCSIFNGSVSYPNANSFGRMENI